MKGTLVVTILTVQSSYLRNVEQPLSGDAEAPDTIQWWIAPTGTWRIRTYGIDHDIHTYSIRDLDNPIETAIANAEKNYGDVVGSQSIIEIVDALDAGTVDAAFQAVGLKPRLEIAAGRFVFWKPDDARYHTQSEPR